MSMVRNPTLDMLRAVAVLMVFTRHIEGAWVICRFGWAGVDLFFVLSGFLVSGLLFHEYQETRRIQPGRFLLRRGFKIYPQFYLMTALTMAGAWLWARPERVSSVLTEVLFVQSYREGVWAHTWSLAVEEHFYLLLTIAIVMLARRGGDDPFRSAPRWIFALCAAILGARIVTWLVYPRTSDYIHIFPSHLRIDSLLVGVLLSYYHVFHRAALTAWMRRAGGWLPSVSILLLSPIAFLDQSSPFVYTAGFSLVSAGWALLLLVVLYPAKKSAQIGPVAQCMVRLGQVSYAFYLWHVPILFLDDRLLAQLMTRGWVVPSWLNLLLAFGATVLVAFLTTWFVEAPILRLRDRWFPSRVKSPLADTRQVLAGQASLHTPLLAEPQ